MRIGNGYDVHRLEPGLRMVLGGVEIPHTSGFVAHSDGDVLLHALSDALLGAAALGDIGQHFSDQDQAFKGIDSRILLRNVCQKVLAKGFSIENVDCTIIAQSPKLAPYIERMREVIALDLGVELDCVSVKATTTERLGFEGRGEGIASICTALLGTSVV